MSFSSTPSVRISAARIAIAAGFSLCAALVASGCTSILGYGDIEVRGEGGQGAASTGSQAGSGGAGGSTGGTAGTGGAAGQGGGAECRTSADCPGESTTCVRIVCPNGFCDTGYAPLGTPCTEGTGDTCDGSGSCLFGLGHLCNVAADCATGYCVKGLCCDDGCDGTCEACTAADTGAADGTCAPVSAFDDPDNDCLPPLIGCDGSGSCAACGFTPTPAGGTCPNACSRCDGGDTCVLSCAMANQCSSTTLSCPPGWHCELECLAADACANSLIVCPDDFDCTVQCLDSDYACAGLAIDCSVTGPCSVECTSGHACDGVDVTCGSNECTASCVQALYQPQLSCGSSCNCQPCI